MLVKILKLTVLYFFVIVLFSSPILSLTASSENYSVRMFGTGMATGYSFSANYNSTFLSEAKGTTRNAESDSFRGNIGFFENTQYFKTVSITSYSISPKSAVVGSTISLYISALNAESVWAKIMAPNGQQQTISLVNNEFVIYNPPSIAGIYNVTFYANSSTGAIASVIDYFELTEAQQPTPPPPSGGSGSGASEKEVITTIEKTCNYVWDCTPWRVCRDGKQTRECKLIGECDKGIEIKKPLEERDCYSALFDISLKLKNIELTQNRHLIFNIDLIEKIGIDKIDVHIKYSIINKEGYEIFSQIETKAVQGNLSYEKRIDEINLVDGEYILRVDILYGNLQRAFAEQKFKVIDGKIVIEINPDTKKWQFRSIIILLLLILILIIFLVIRKLFLIIKHKRKKLHKGLVKSKRKTGKYFVYLIILLISGISFVAFPSLKITGKIVEKAFSDNLNVIFAILLICIIIILLTLLKNKAFINLNKISELVSRFRIGQEKNSNRISNLIGKDVYLEKGEYIGKIKDVLLGKNRIDSLKIKLGKKDKFKVDGIIISWKQVLSCGKIAIIKDYF